MQMRLAVRNADRALIGIMYDFKLEAIGIGEKDRIIAGAIVVFARRIENSPTVRGDAAGEFVDLFATLGAKGDFAQTDTALVESEMAVGFVGRGDP
jgi:hypothetical protein